LLELSAINCWELLILSSSADDPPRWVEYLIAIFGGPLFTLMARDQYKTGEVPGRRTHGQFTRERDPCTFWFSLGIWIIMAALGWIMFLGMILSWFGWELFPGEKF